MARLEPIEKGADADLVRELLAHASERLPPGPSGPGCSVGGLARLPRARAAEVDRLTGAAAGARSPGRSNHRNGYRERGWETRAGRIELAIAKLRKGSYFPAFPQPRRLSAPPTSLRGIGLWPMAEKALTAVIHHPPAGG